MSEPVPGRLLANVVSLFVLAGLLAFGACYGSDVTRPAEGKGTSYPCGVWGVACTNGACCPWAHVCGYSGPWSRCEEGYCCADGDPFYGAEPDGGGAPRRVPQRRP